MMTAMDIRDTSDVIKCLNQAAKARQTWRVETFTMHRESPKHGSQEVEVKILDRGPDFSPRYHVSGTTEDGLHCSGNSGDELQEVILLTHWFELDK